MNEPKLIFIVDDDPLINMLVVRRFTAEGYKVEAFDYGEDCIQSLRKNPDLVILDYYFIKGDRRMMNGIEVFDKIKELSPDTPIIMLSGQDKGEIVLELARKGVDDYIIKDNNLVENLLAAARDLFVSKAK